MLTSRSSLSLQMLRSDVVPDFVVLLTLPVSKLALQECNLMHIPTMAIVDRCVDIFRQLRIST
jgi:ribosomal protein S2